MKFYKLKPWSEVIELPEVTGPHKKVRSGEAKYQWMGTLSIQDEMIEHYKAQRLMTETSPRSTTASHGGAVRLVPVHNRLVGGKYSEWFYPKETIEHVES